MWGLTIKSTTPQLQKEPPKASLATLRNSAVQASASQPIGVYSGNPFDLSDPN